jgi:hypothetical protein
MQISAELSRPIERQTKFFEKSDPTPSEVQEFEWAGERIRKASLLEKERLTDPNGPRFSRSVLVSDRKIW